MPRHWTGYPYPHYYWLNFGPRYHPVTRPDDEIATDLINRLTYDSWINPSQVRVAVQDGVVTLTGQVDSVMQKRAVGDDAWDTPGVRDVQNDLTIARMGHPAP